MINFTLPDESEGYIHRVGRVGRAERLGLAISIIAGGGICEQVWYHKCSNRGKGCTNFKAIENGGCTIWYDETTLLRGVEERLHETISELNDDFSLPDHIASQGTAYGEEIKVDDYVPDLHLGLLGPTVKELGTMEVLAQNMFLELERLYSH